MEIFVRCGSRSMGTRAGRLRHPLCKGRIRVVADGNHVSPAAACLANVPQCRMQVEVPCRSFTLLGKAFRQALRMTSEGWLPPFRS